MNREMGATILMVTHDAYQRKLRLQVLFLRTGACSTN